MTLDRILVVEPQCVGFEHAAFNAAMLSALAAAYPTATLCFMAEAGHGDMVREALTQAAASERCLERLEWLPLAIPARGLSAWARLRPELRVVEQIGAAIRARPPQLLFVGSVTGQLLLALKLAFWRGRLSLPTLVVPHRLLNTLLTPRRRPDRNWILEFRQTSRLPTPAQLHFLALSPAILAELRLHFPRLARRFYAIDPPYLMHAVREETASPPGKLRFGYLGGGYKGLRPFYELACHLQDRAARVEFAMVGFHSVPSEREVFGQVIRDIGEQPLPTQELGERMARLTYAVGYSDPQTNQLTASASFLDALAYGKPGVYIRTPFIAHCFERMGEVGYLVDSMRQLEDTVRKLVDDFPVDRYRQQVHTILAGRKLFTPEMVGEQLRAVGSEVTARS